MERYRKQPDANSRRRGDTVMAVGVTGRRVTLSPVRPFGSGQFGFTLIELVISITIMTILTLGVMPLVKLAVKRQREQQLRDTLRQMRIAIDEFHRDTLGMVCTGTTTPPAGAGGPPTAVDPRSRVAISDCTIFGVDNPDRYPPDLQTLVDGVNVIPRGGPGTTGIRGLESGGTRPSDSSTTLDSELSTKKKIYLRAIPIDPITGKNEWDLCSNTEPCKEGSWSGENVFDVRSKSKEKALNGEKYSDW